MDDWREIPTRSRRPERERMHQLARDPVQLCLTVVVGANPGARYIIEGSMVVGRDASCDICLPEPGISRRHALLRVKVGNEIEIEDLDTTNGTSVNGVAVTKQTLRPGDRLQVGDRTILAVVTWGELEKRLIELQKRESLQSIVEPLAQQLTNTVKDLREQLSHLGQKNPAELGLVLQRLEEVAKHAQTAAQQLEQWVDSRECGDDLPTTPGIPALKV